MSKKPKLPDVREFLRRLALWLVRNRGADMARDLNHDALLKRINCLPEDVSAEALLGIVDELGYRAISTLCSHACYDTLTRRHAIAATDLFLREAAGCGIGEALIGAWVAAGGDIGPLRQPGINQRLVRRARRDGLVMRDYHTDCGTAHCIAGWYTTLGNAKAIEKAYSCELAATLVFAVNNPGEALPYMGSSQERGEVELERLETLNPKFKEGASHE